MPHNNHTYFSVQFVLCFAIENGKAYGNDDDDYSDILADCSERFQTRETKEELFSFTTFLSMERFSFIVQFVDGI